MIGVFLFDLAYGFRRLKGLYLATHSQRNQAFDYEDRLLQEYQHYPHPSRCDQPCRQTTYFLLLASIECFGRLGVVGSIPVQRENQLGFRIRLGSSTACCHTAVDTGLKSKNYEPGENDTATAAHAISYNTQFRITKRYVKQHELWY